MIHATTLTDFTAYITTKENRINTTAANWSHLFKFRNDMTGEVVYCYPKTENIYNRYTKCTFEHNATTEVFNGKIAVKPVGYWTYEVYEISWQENIQLDGAHSPATELQVLPTDLAHGVVEGLVEIGIFHIEKKPDSEEVQYTQHSHYVVELIIDYAGTGYTSAPTITIEAGNITTATATCTVSGGEVNSVTITDAGSGYTTNPKVTLSGGGYTTEAQISANIYQKNWNKRWL